MYACICFAVVEDDVAAAVRHGAHSVAEIGDLTQAGTGCGSCHDRLDDLIESNCAHCPLAAARVA